MKSISTFFFFIIGSAMLFLCSAGTADAFRGFYHSSLSFATPSLPRELNFNATKTDVAPTAAEASYYLNLFETPSSYSSEDFTTLPLFAHAVCVAYQNFPGEPAAVNITMQDLASILSGTPVELAPGRVTGQVVLHAAGPSRVATLAALKAHGALSAAAYPVVSAAHPSYVPASSEADAGAKVRDSVAAGVAVGILPLSTATRLPGGKLGCMSIRTTDWRCGSSCTVITFPGVRDQDAFSEFSVKVDPGKVSITHPSAGVYPLAGAVLLHVNRRASCGARHMEAVLLAKHFLTNPSWSSRLGFVPLPIDRQNRALVSMVNSTCPTPAFDFVQSTGSAVATRLLSVLSREYWTGGAVHNFFFGFWCGGSVHAIRSLKRGFHSSGYLINALSSEWTAAERKAQPSVVTLPLAAFSVSIVFNLPGVYHLAVPVCAVPSIFNGSISSWSDPWLAAANPTVQLPKEQIRIAVRNVRAGLTEVFLTALVALEQRCNRGRFASFKKGAVWPSSLPVAFTGGSSSTVQKAVRKNEYSVGFLSADEVRAGGYKEAALLDEETGKEHKPSPAVVKDALENHAVYEVAETGGAETGQVALDLKDAGYPLAQMLHLAFDQEQRGDPATQCARLGKALRFLQWTYTSTRATVLAESSSYVALPRTMREKALRKLYSCRCGAPGEQGALFFPEEQEEEDKLPLIVGLAVGLGVLLLIGLFVLQWCCVSGSGGRSTKYAVKDSVLAAYVFTDIERSSTLWAEAPSAMQEALNLHDSIIEDELERKRGYRISTAGDSYFCCFSSVPDSVSFALAVQQRLFEAAWPQAIDEAYRRIVSEQPGDDQSMKQQSFNNFSDPDVRASRLDPRCFHGLAVRIGINAGIAEPKCIDGQYDYFGDACNRAARVEAAGQGGQIVVTGSVMEQIKGDARFGSAHVDTTDLGPQQLRGIPEKVPLFSLLPSSLAGRKFGPLRLEAAGAALGLESGAGAAGWGGLATAGLDYLDGASAADNNEQQQHSLTASDAEHALVYSSTRGASHRPGVSSAALRFVDQTNIMLAIHPAEKRLQLLRELATRWRADFNHEAPTTAERKLLRSKKVQEDTVLLCRIAVKVAAADAAANNNKRRSSVSNSMSHERSLSNSASKGKLPHVAESGQNDGAVIVHSAVDASPSSSSASTNRRDSVGTPEMHVLPVENE